MTDPVQFVPAAAPLGPDKDAMREVAALLRPDMSDGAFDNSWTAFLATRDRVNNPRRRQGNDVSRAGPVLFPPGLHARRQLADLDARRQLAEADA